ncbi:MAG: hypothetical protein ACREI2_08990 [Nitrospiraceae bacterium]
MPKLRLKQQPAPKLFPERAVEDCLRDCLAEEAKDQTIMGITRDPLMPVIDSLVVVEILVAVETIIGGELPESLVKKGGYHSINETVEDLLPKIKRHWLDHS